ncbi:hypothetical protein J6590_003809 [Homalodisca vitripennis]|nr:hypothetical protein J6590_003809 [Homalodisca vitripennis]
MRIYLFSASKLKTAAFQAGHIRKPDLLYWLKIDQRPWSTHGATHHDIYGVLHAHRTILFTTVTKRSETARAAQFGRGRESSANLGAQGSPRYTSCTGRGNPAPTDATSCSTAFTGAIDSLVPIVNDTLLETITAATNLLKAALKGLVVRWMLGERCSLFLRTLLDPFRQLGEMKHSCTLKTHNYK